MRARLLLAAVLSAAAFVLQAAPASADFGFLTQWGSSGTGPGQFQAPADVAVDGSGDVYVVDSMLDSVQKFDPNGQLLTTFGAPKGPDCTETHDLPPPPGELCVPRGITVRGSGGSANVYVVDTYGGRIQQFTGEGKFVRMWGNLWCGQGPEPPAPQFCFPSRDTVDVQGNVYVNDASDVIRIFDADGTAVNSFRGPLCSLGCLNHGLAAGPKSRPDELHVTDTFWGLSATLINQTGTAPGALAADSIFGGVGSSPAQFGNHPSARQGPLGIAVDPSGRVYIADNVNDRVELFESLGQFISAFGSKGTGPGQFDDPQGIAVDSSGNVYVADTNNDRVEKFGQQGGPTPPPTPITPNTSGPTLAGLTVTHPKFREGLERPGHRNKRRIPKGTTILYVLSEPASVTFTFTRIGGGASASRRVTRPGESGLNRFRFSGRIGKARLSAGQYRVSARATDVDGNRSKTKKANFNIVR